MGWGDWESGVRALEIGLGMWGEVVALRCGEGQWGGPMGSVNGDPGGGRSSQYSNIISI